MCVHVCVHASERVTARESESDTWAVPTVLCVSQLFPNSWSSWKLGFMPKLGKRYENRYQNNRRPQKQKELLLTD